MQKLRNGKLLNISMRPFPDKHVNYLQTHTNNFQRSGISFCNLTTPWTQDVSWTDIRRPGRLLNVLCTFNLHLVPRGRNSRKYSDIGLTNEYSTTLVCTDYLFQTFNFFQLVQFANSFKFFMYLAKDTFIKMTKTFLNIA